MGVEMSCEHYFHHAKFIENSKKRFAVWFYCMKCLEGRSMEYPPFKNVHMDKDGNEIQEKGKNADDEI